MVSAFEFYVKMVTMGEGGRGNCVVNLEHLRSGEGEEVRVKRYKNTQECLPVESVFSSGGEG